MQGSRKKRKKERHDLLVRNERLARREKTPRRREGAFRKKPRITLPLDVWPETTISAFGVKDAQFAIPRDFSLISNPDETLQMLITLRRTLSLPSLQRILLDYRQCESLDLCASVIQDVLTLRGRRQAKLRSRKIEVSGKFSKRPEIDIMLVNSGILKHLRIPISKAIPSEVLKRLRSSDLRTGTPTPPNLTSETELAGSALADFFDECLRTENHHLKPEWKSKLIDLITEVLDNAEQHAGGNRQWYTIGFYNRHQNPDEGGECHIVLFNFGETIYESLKRPDTSEELKRQIGELADEHQSRGFFAFLTKHFDLLIPMWQEESLWTLYALQEGVSRFRYKPNSSDRGNGTVRMIEFFSELASENPKMALVSGKTHILFDGKYRISPSQVGQETRKVIAFNDSNSLLERPDPNYVRTLQHHFPGTLMSLKFKLKRVDLALRKEKLNDHHSDN